MGPLSPALPTPFTPVYWLTLPPTRTPFIVHLEHLCPPFLCCLIRAAASYALFTWLRKWLWFCPLTASWKFGGLYRTSATNSNCLGAWIAFGFCSFECICSCSLGIQHRRGPLRPNFYVWKKFLLECALFPDTALLRYRRVGSFSHPLMNCFTLSLKDPRNLLYCIVTMDLRSNSCSFWNTGKYVRIQQVFFEMSKSKTKKKEM